MPSRHAEVDAINKMKSRRNIPRYVDLFVIRLNKAGGLGESRPCSDCLKMLETCGLNIKHIYYSTASGTIVREKMSEMANSPDTYVSSGVRKRGINTAHNRTVKR
jgi:hypothetical protein